MAHRMLLGIAVILLSSLEVQAQTTSRLEAARRASRPRRSVEDEARRQTQNARTRDRRIVGSTRGRGLLHKRDGRYVYPPDKYRPDYWSPSIRQRRDHRSSWSRRGIQRTRRVGRNRCTPSLRRYGGIGGYRGSYYYARRDNCGDAYEQGRRDADSEYTRYIAAQRAGQLLDLSRARLDEGMAYFRSGQYDRAAISWLGAAEANHTSAGARVHAGHALFAVGRYTDSVRLLARAFELAPRLATSVYDLRRDYARPADFERHLATLRQYVREYPGDPDGVTLLGYVLSYSEGPSAAHTALKRARVLRPSDAFVEKLWNAVKLAAPQAGVKPQPPTAASPVPAQIKRKAKILRGGSNVRRI